ncbi:hypothetical protein BA1DRAFT_01516 [Photorhabdus aegyptia]|uniref:Uncharacterized protein n=1 Tax=Photorhabdus aegyptia TaxID=2805098 RepID=A0A022PJQ4_9GAMM|nr:hypothetical protein BA1DRAFT_01516 [Photorhabdus aegyptia]
MLQSALLGQNHLIVINPDLQKKISEAIGYKIDRTLSLHPIRAALFFHWSVTQ